MLLEVKTNIKKEKLPTSRGCKVIGKLFVNKVRSVPALSFCFDRCMQVAGEFHIGFGRDTEPVHQDGLDSMEGNHIHRFTMQQARDFNTSRTLPLICMRLSRHRHRRPHGLYGATGRGEVQWFASFAGHDS